jgi:hypothetical protein
MQTLKKFPATPQSTGA